MKWLLTQQNKGRVIEAISKLGGAKPWDITVEPHVKHRTNEQNRRLWALHTLAAEVTGYTPAQMHELALSYYFGSQRLQVGEKAVVWLPKKRSSDKDTAEFNAFMTAVEEWYITELGVWLD